MIDVKKGYGIIIVYQINVIMIWLWEGKDYVIVGYIKINVIMIWLWEGKDYVIVGYMKINGIGKYIYCMLSLPHYSL